MEFVESHQGRMELNCKIMVSMKHQKFAGSTTYTNTSSVDMASGRPRWKSLIRKPLQKQKNGSIGLQPPGTTAT